MKNVEEGIRHRPVFRVRMQNAPPPSGYFIRYVSGIDENHEVQPGYWLAEWYWDSQGGVNFNFEPEKDLHWKTEDQAKEVSDFLRKNAEIETIVVAIGV